MKSILIKIAYLLMRRASKNYSEYRIAIGGKCAEDEIHRLVINGVFYCIVAIILILMPVVPFLYVKFVLNI